MLNEAIDKGILAAHEAKEAFRFNVLQSHIEAIHKEVELFSAPYKVDREAILAFEKQYLKQIGQRCSRITPPNLSAATPRSIDDLYVYPSFTRPRVGDKLQMDRLEKDEFLLSIHRAVLLGDPGAGKSTLTLKLCYDLVRNYSSRIFAGKKELTPILIILRNYGAEKKERRCSILEFIETEAKTKYQLPTAPANTFKYLLLTGRAAVIFDGLDELLDTSYRQEIRDDVESFCHLYPSVPVLVTSRKVGYEQAPLDENLFEAFLLAPFDNQQVRAYVHKWFALADETDLTEKQRKSKSEAFLKDSAMVQDLRSNPLMLALLCTIYHEEHYIPRYRPDVYEKCALMLFERWDKTRNIYTPPLPEEEVRPLMEHLANWIYQDEQLRAGVTEEELIVRTTEYLHEWLYENIHKAEKMAREFVTFCRGRAWVFTDTGTKKFGENLYQFTHTTFLEYFAAANLVRNSRTPDELLSVLSPRIARREWDVIAQLAFQLQSKKNLGAGDELLTKIVDQSLISEDGWNLSSFAVRCLQFIIPRPKVRRYITTVYIRRCVAQRYRETSYILDELFNAVPENEITVIDTLDETLVELAKSNEELEVLATLEFFIYFPARKGEEAQASWSNITKHLLDVIAEKIDILGPKSLLLSHMGLFAERISIFDFIKWHGIGSLVITVNSDMLPNFGRASIIEIFVRQFLRSIGAPTPKITSSLKKDLHDLGEVPFLYPPPWLGKEVYTNNIRSYLYSHLENKTYYFEIENMSYDEVFGLFIAFALYLEVNDKYRSKFVGHKKMTINMSRQSSMFYLLLSARFVPNLIDKAQEELEEHGFTPGQKHFILRWIRQEINLVSNITNL